MAKAFADAGHHVQVVSVEWDQQDGQPKSWVEAECVKVLQCPARSLVDTGGRLGQLQKWTLVSVLAAQVARQAKVDPQFDLVFVFGPAVVTHGLFRWATRKRSVRTFLYVTDFFPFHHQAIGLLPKGLIFEMARRAEQNLMRRFDVIGCMSPANAAYLRRNYRLREEQRICQLPLWGPSEVVTSPDPLSIRRRFGVPVDRPLLVFGGQITEGRGIETLLEAAALLTDAPGKPHIVMIGQGRLTAQVQAYIDSGGTSLTLLPPLPREDYLHFASAADLGLIATVENVDVPTFPSKTIDYLRAGLPILAAVEATTDYGRIIEEAGYGRSVIAGSAPKLVAAAEELLGDPDQLARMRGAGRRALEEVFNTERAVERIIGECFGRDVEKQHMPDIGTYTV